jgi:hypothetical protein
VVVLVLVLQHFPPAAAPHSRQVGTRQDLMGRCVCR